MPDRPRVVVVSAIVTSYNRPEFVRHNLASLAAQTRPPEEVIVADDGSTDQNLARLHAVIAESSLDVRLIAQEHRGFRAAACRNKAVREAKGDTLFFSDGDLVYYPDVIARHLEANADRRAWVTGFCLPLSPEETATLSRELIRDDLESLWPSATDPRLARLDGYDVRFRAKTRVARLLPFEVYLRKIALRGGHCSMTRAAFEAINGFDEAYVGWGCEDDDLGLRLLLSGVWGRSVIPTARALHQHHPTEERTLKGDRLVSVNNRYHKRSRWRRYVADVGLSASGRNRPS